MGRVMNIDSITLLFKCMGVGNTWPSVQKKTGKQ